jgi:hypothetical protein
LRLASLNFIRLCRFEKWIRSAVVVARAGIALPALSGLPILPDLTQTAQLKFELWSRLVIFGHLWSSLVIFGQRHRD